VKWFGHGDYSSTILQGWRGQRAGLVFPRAQPGRGDAMGRRGMKSGRTLGALISISTTSSDRSKVTF
jgi:hypothetical protein